MVNHVRMNPAPSNMSCLAALFTGSLLFGACEPPETNKAIESGSIDVNGVHSRSDHHIDTSAASVERMKILSQFLDKWGGLGPEYDTLLDLNYDGIDDYAVGWYGLAGNGLKHNWEVHIWHPELDTYVEDTNLTGLPNATFYREDSLITSFYIAYGGGHGEQWEWLNGRWQQTMTFYVENKENNSEWLLTDPRTGTKRSVQHAYQGIPPSSILKSQYLQSPIDE